MFIGPLEPVSNKATWMALYELRDDETDELIDLSSVNEITIEVRDKSCVTVLSATLTGGSIEHVDTGIFKWTFSKDQMSALTAKTYEVGCILEGEGESLQLIIGTLPVLDGVVR